MGTVLAVATVLVILAAFVYAVWSYGRAQKRAQLAVTLDRDTVAAGETLRVRVEVLYREAFEMNGGRVELIYENTYKYREREPGHQGEASHTKISTRTDREVVYTAPLVEPGTSAAGSSMVREVELPVPPNAPPTCDGTITDAASVTLK